MSLIFVGAIVLCCQNVKAQCDKNKGTTETNQPRMTVTYITKPTVNPLIEQVKLLTGGDEILTEQVILQINVAKKNAVLGMLPNEQYDNLSDTERKNYASETEILDIIKQITD